MDEKREDLGWSSSYDSSFGLPVSSRSFLSLVDVFFIFIFPRRRTCGAKGAGGFDASGDSFFHKRNPDGAGSC